MNLHQPLSVLPGIGPKSAEKYKKLGIETVEDLLLYFPFRYEDFKSKNNIETEDKSREKEIFEKIEQTNLKYRDNIKEVESKILLESKKIQDNLK